MAKYFDYNNIFLAENATEFLENIGINEHVIKLKENNQPLFGSIYSLRLIELEILKTYIITNLINGFIRPFKSFIGASILFNKKSDKSFRFYVDY